MKLTIGVAVPVAMGFLCLLVKLNYFQSESFLDNNSQPNTSVTILSNGLEDVVNEEEVEDLEDTGKAYLENEIGGVTYCLKPLSAYDYLKNIGEQPSISDNEALKNESVFILELESKSSEILSTENLKLEYGEAVKYLTSSIVSDIEIRQASKNYSPEGVLYDHSISHKNKLRLIVFFKGVDASGDFQFIYQDRLFGSGQVQLTT